MYLLQNEFVSQTKCGIFFNTIKFYERGYQYLFEKKTFLLRKEKNFVKIIHILYLKNIIIFRIVLLHFNNHSREKGKLSNKTPSHRKILLAFPDNIGLINY